MPLVTMRKARITLGTLWLMTALGGAASAQDPLARQRSLVGRMGLEMLAPAAPAGAPHRAAAPFVRGPRVAMPGPNILVNDPTGESCGGGCTQSGESIAVSGSSVVIGFNDSKGTFDGTNNVSGYAYSTDGGMSFIDGGVLPSAGTGDVLLGNPALVFCNGSFYYASLYRTGSGSTTPDVSAVSVSKGALSGPTLT